MKSSVLFSVAATLVLGTLATDVHATPTVLKITNAAQTVDDFYCYDNLSGPNTIIFDSQANGGQVWLNGVTYPLNYTATATYVRIYLIGGSGNDIVITDGVQPAGKSMSVFVYLEEGDDNFTNDASYTVSVYGGDGNDLLIGGEGLDQLRGENGNDDLQGGDGPDYLHGGDGDDNIEGGEGNDNCIGGAGADVVMGQAGDDMLVGGVELSYGVWGPDYTMDLLEGGSGADLFRYRYYKKLTITLQPVRKVTAKRYEPLTLRPVASPPTAKPTAPPTAQLQYLTYTVEVDTIVDFKANEGDTKVSELVQ